MATKATHPTKKVVAKKGGAAARANGGRRAKVDWRARVNPAQVTEATERHRVIKRATSRVKTSARVDTVNIDS